MENKKNMNVVLAVIICLAFVGVLVFFKKLLPQLFAVQSRMVDCRSKQLLDVSLCLE